MNINKFNFVDFLAIAFTTIVYGIVHDSLLSLMAGYGIVGILYVLGTYALTEKVDRRRPVIIRSAAFFIWCFFGPVLTLTVVAFLSDFFMMLFRRDSDYTW
jgi:hypothetical protein